MEIKDFIGFSDLLSKTKTTKDYFRLVEEVEKANCFRVEIDESKFNIAPVGA